MNTDANDIFKSEESILRALSFVRQSAVPLEKKDVLRDLFLNYTGSAESERQKIKGEILANLKAEPQLASLLPKEKPPEHKKTDSGLGTTRPAPSFTAPAIVSKPIKPSPAPTPLPPEEKRAEPAKTERSETPPQPSTFEPPKIPTPRRASMSPTGETATTPAAPPAAPNPNAKERISAIKHDINSRVGNPVNLIDSNEQVGREYMTALLDAMKRTSRGDTDLSRLESAYQAALAVISQSIPPEVPTESPPATPTPTPVKVEPEPTPPADPVPVPVPINLEKEERVPVPPETPAEPPKKPEPEKTSAWRGLYHRPEDEIAEEDARTIEEASSKPESLPPVSELRPQTIAPEMPLAPIPKAPMPTVTKDVPEVISKKPEPRPEPAAPKATDERLHPLKDSKAALPEQISRLKAEAKEREEAAKKPITDLKAPEIDQGLRQLLSEWTLFKGGGFFRTKPLGIDHPLYKQLNKLPMASIVAGRFEGVTPEIRHNLADYMTGWRYEQGILHEMGETFENYLRRVVKEILKKQRGSLSASKSDAK